MIAAVMVFDAMAAFYVLLFTRRVSCRLLIHRLDETASNKWLLNSDVP
jgi:hypothetical protein